MSISSTLALIPHRTRYQILCAAIIWCLVFFIWWVAHGEKCSMQSHLLPMLMDMVKVLSTTSFTYWMDYGTLLGLYRDHTIIPWEFDLDIGIPHDTCDAMELTLKQKMGPNGYHIYGMNDYIPMKANWLLGHSPYIHSPCIRIYDPTKQYSTDIYWYDTIQPEQIVNGKNIVNNRPIAQYYPEFKDKPIMCNDEGYSDEIPGGCRLVSEIYPITSMTYEGMTLPLPANSSAVLIRMYGENWNQPRPKGYKILLCNWFPTHPMFTTTAFMALVLLTIFYIYRGREIWYQLRTSRPGGYTRVAMERHY